MKKQLLFSYFILSINICFSQISFEKGYVIDNFDKKIECLIKNLEWRNNPTEISYKTSENATIINTNIQLIKEFEIYNSAKFIRSTVQIDKSSDNLIYLSFEKEPQFVQETIFLKILLQGAVNLFMYENESLQRYFFSKTNTDITQLVYKQYFINQNQIAENNAFQKQLWDALPCSSIPLSIALKLAYKKDNLLNFCINYNQCVQAEFKTFDQKRKSKAFNISLKARINTVSLQVSRIPTRQNDTNFSNNLNFGFGAEIEYIFPFNKNKWSLFIEPTYHNYNVSESFDDPGFSIQRTATVDYKSIEIPIMARHYMFLNQNSKLFLNTGLIIDFSGKSNILFQYAANQRTALFEINATNYLALGFGYKFKNKLSAEFRYHLPRQVLTNYLYWNSSYKSSSLILGYTIF